MSAAISNDLRARWPNTRARKLRAAIGELRGGRPIQERDRESPLRNLARAWLDVTDIRKAKIYIANAKSERFVLRSIVLEHGYDEVAREAIGHILESAMDAFLSGDEIGVLREEARAQIGQEEETPPVTPPVVPIPKGGMDTRLALLYSAKFLDGRTVQQSGALALLWSYPTSKPWRFLVSTRLHYDAPLKWVATPVGATFAGFEGDAIAGVERSLSRRASVHALGGFGIRRTRVVPYAPPQSPATATPTFWRTLPMVTALFGAEVRLISALSLLAEIGIDMDVTGTHYDLARDGAVVKVLSPWFLRPLMQVGVALQL